MGRYDEMLAVVEDLQQVYERAARLHDERLTKLRALIQDVRDSTTASLDGLATKVDDLDLKVVTDEPDA